MARFTAEISAPTDLQNVDDATIGRLCLDLGLGETAAVNTQEWDWFKTPAELSAGVAAGLGSAALIMRPATGVPRNEAQPTLHAVPDHRQAPSQQSKKHAPNENTVTPDQLMSNLGYDRPMLKNILSTIRPLEVRPGQQVTDITRGRINGFVRGMMESATFSREQANKPPMTALEKDRLFPQNLHAPQSDERTASYYTIARNRVLNVRYRKPAFKAKSDAALQDVGWAHEIAEMQAETTTQEGRIERMANSVKRTVKNKLRGVAGRIKLSIATKMEQRHIKADAAHLQKVFSRLPPLAFFDRDPQVDTMPDWQPPADVVAIQKMARVDNDMDAFQKGGTVVNPKKKPVFEPTAGLTLNPRMQIREAQSAQTSRRQTAWAA